MAKFRKKPVVVEAEQYFDHQEIGTWPSGVCKAPACGGEPHVHTLEGQLHVSDGDWIITGVKNEQYPCRPDLFAATYEPVEEQDQ